MSCSVSERGARSQRGKAALATVVLAAVLGVLAPAAPSAAQAPSVAIDFPPSPVADAAEHADRAQLEELLKQGADVNAPQVDGMTALHFATYHDDRKAVELLVHRGANVKAANRYGVTPLSLACTNGNAAIVELLLASGADPNASLPGGESPLMTAARTGVLAAVKVLLSHGAAVDAKEEKRGQTALIWAAAEGHAEVVEALVAAGADIRTRLASGFTPLLFAARDGRSDVVRVLLKAGADVNEPVPAGKRLGYGGRLPPDGATPLLLAVINGHFELAAQLLDAGADPNADLPGYTVLHALAAVRNPGVGDNDPPPDGSGKMTSLELLTKLAARRANLNARMTKKANLNNTRLNEIGATPFLLASLTADAALMKALAKLGADPGLTNADNSTPLMVAAGLATRSPGEDAGTEGEVLEALQVALDLGADVNAVDNNGETAMHAAAYKNLPKVVKFLAAHGSKVDVWNRNDKFGWTPLAIAIGYRFGNFKPSPETEAAVREVMIAAGVSPPAKVAGKNR